jgi:hypothetical protein
MSAIWQCRPLNRSGTFQILKESACELPSQSLRTCGPGVVFRTIGLVSAIVFPVSTHFVYKWSFSVPPQRTIDNERASDPRLLPFCYLPIFGIVRQPIFHDQPIGPPAFARSTCGKPSGYVRCTAIGWPVARGSAKPWPTSPVPLRPVAWGPCRWGFDQLRYGHSSDDLGHLEQRATAIGDHRSC